MASSSEDELDLAQTNAKQAVKPKKEEKTCPIREGQGETDEGKADVKSTENGNGAVKKEEVKDEDEEAKPDVDAKPLPKKRKKSAENGAKGKEAAVSKKEKEPKPEKQQEQKPEPKKADTKKKSDTAKPTKTKAQYDMPGQTQATPNTGEPLAKFYLSLREQRPDSEIASKWCVQRGLLSREEAEAWLKKNGKSTTARNTAKSPSKPRAPAAKKSADKPKKKEARKPAKPKKQKDVPFDDSDEYGEDDDDDEDDDEYEAEVMPAKSKRISGKSAGRSSAPTKAKPASNGQAKGGKKRNRRQSESEEEVSGGDEDDSEEDDMPLAKKKPAARKASGVKSADPESSEDELELARNTKKKASLDEGDSSSDEPPLANRQVKVAA